MKKKQFNSKYLAATTQKQQRWMRFDNLETLTWLLHRHLKVFVPAAVAAAAHNGAKPHRESPLGVQQDKQQDDGDRITCLKSCPQRNFCGRIIW